MSGIYGNSQEDRHYENILINQPDDATGSISWCTKCDKLLIDCQKDKCDNCLDESKIIACLDTPLIP